LLALYNSKKKLDFFSLTVSGFTIQHFDTFMKLLFFAEPVTMQRHASSINSTGHP